MTSQYLRDSNGALILGGKTLQQAVFAGEVDPGNIVAVREIVDPPASTTVSTDTALFSGPRANYTITPGAGFVTVTDNVGTDGIDTVRNVERLRFPNGDGTFQTVTVAVPNAPTNVTATRGNRNATVTWVRPTGNGAAIASYDFVVKSGTTVISTTNNIAPGTLSHRDRADPRAEVHVRGAWGQRVRCRAVRGLQRDHGGEHPCGTDRAGGHPRQLLGVAVVDSGG